MTWNLFLRLTRDRRGATAIEFTILAPVMLLLMTGLGDLTYQVYVQSVLNGAVQKAARDSGIEGGAANGATIDAAVQSIVQQVAPRATFVSTRKSYDSFSEVAPEPFTDSNHNGVRDPGECFTDENGNGSWDADPGVSGQGSASAVTLYTMTASYPRVFPVAGLLGWSSSTTISASTLLKNQPYATQTTNANVTICT
ncbi:pilus assembly protein [Sphingomonas sp. TF3]|uniref:TadE/TadG family type IV pilus assembly protein n=1 Tax=Sphingomonas sp. TF3 TaxID=2495580 RepID=UPI000F8889AD|nr:TadE/TadG family type IV pilus assembly protein [Sphingomonas sp. TF3]RUN75273.1 pilus assembly protein [Sphingomonas sp. TF3]